MAIQLRDTQFGHLTRLLSRRRWFPYPDEVDISLSKKFVDSDTMRHQGNGFEKTDDTNKPGRPSWQASDGPNTDLEACGAQNVVSREKETFLVDWYGPDDPEVGKISRFSFQHF